MTTTAHRIVPLPPKCEASGPSRHKETPKGLVVVVAACNRPLGHPGDHLEQDYKTAKVYARWLQP